ncbi:hypothetical protein [Paenibacillus solani]|uniref:hypothetical protein n=1 Tax=Paenibacillus solani TaxID=1705565 RepID=UPI000A3E24DA|nr:hypothetical protein [Paenibacillus solani]
MEQPDTLTLQWNNPEPAPVSGAGSFFVNAGWNCFWILNAKLFVFSTRQYS